MSLFDPDGKFMQITSTMLDYVKLGLLFMLFSIPVLPMGAAAAAAMTVGMKIARGEAPAVWKPFWKAFKANFRQGTLLLLIFALIFALLGFDWYQVMKMESTTVVRVARAGIVLLAILLSSMALYSFAIMMISLLAITLAREVSLIKVMTSLPMGARMRLMTCSSVTRKKIWLLVMPSTCPASVWPTGTDSIPPR